VRHANMGGYLKRQKDRTDNLDAIALDRSMASFCARQQRNHKFFHGKVLLSGLKNLVTSGSECALWSHGPPFSSDNRLLVQVMQPIDTLRFFIESPVDEWRRFPRELNLGWPSVDRKLSDAW
jgi:hypothetical protein